MPPGRQSNSNTSRDNSARKAACDKAIADERQDLAELSKHWLITVYPVPDFAAQLARRQVAYAVAPDIN
jgi:leucyl aminopeptidase (aminopeptidase T)